MASVWGAGAYWLLRKPADPIASAQGELDRGKPEAARLVVSTLLKTRPDDPEGIFLLGKITLALGNAVAAERLLHRATDLGIVPERMGLPLAKALLAQGKSGEALNVLKADTGSGEDLAHIYVARAQALEQLGDLGGADVALVKARDLAPSLLDVPLEAGLVAIREKDLVKADQAADRALSINGRSSSASVLKSRIMEQRGQRAAAIDMLTKALGSADSHSQEARLERGRLFLAAGRIPDARADVENVLHTNPKSVAAIFLKAEVAGSAGDYGTADVLLQQVDPVIGSLPDGWFVKAKVKLKVEQLEQAADAIERHLVHNPDDVDGHKLQAMIALAARRPGIAIETLTRFVTAGTADPETFDLLGDAQAMAGKLAQASDAFAHAGKLAPNNADIQAHLGLARLLMGDSPGAMEALERSVTLAPTKIEAGQQLVVAAVTSGQPDRAASFLAQLRGQGEHDGVTGRLEALVDIGRFDFAGAESRLAATVSSYPDDRSARRQLAQVLVMDGKPVEAEAALEALLAREPADAPGLQALASLLEEDGRRPRAIAVATRAHASAPADLEIALTLASLLERAGQPEQALTILSGDTLPLDAPSLLAARARLQTQANQPDAAAKTYETLLLRSPSPSNSTAYAEFLSTHGRVVDAEKHLVAAAAAAPQSPEIQRALVLLKLRTSGVEAALATAASLRSNPKTMPAAAVLAGDVLQAANRPGEAAEALKAEFTKAPSSDLAIRASSAENAAHGPIAASQFLRKWTDGHPDDVAAAGQLSVLLTSSKDIAGAASILEGLLARAPNDTGVMNNLAVAYDALGDARAYPLALRAYLATLQPSMADTLACILLKRGQAAEAVSLLRFGTRQMPTNLPVQLHLAQAERQAGLRDEARVLLKSLKDKNFEGKAIAIKLLAQVEGE